MARSVKGVWMSVVLALACGGVASAREQLLNLPAASKGGRFAAPEELVWPAEPGAADICLWADDKFAACSITIDDNCRPDHDWWLALAGELGIKLTWFVVTDGPTHRRNPGFAGTWADFQRLADAGHSIQSHTTNHKSRGKNEPPLAEAELEAMYRDSLAAINAHITNNVATCIAYPSGEAHPEIVARYALAARGVYGIPNAVNTIDYLNTNKGGDGDGYLDVVLTGTCEEPKFLRDKKALRRGWNIILYHFVHAGRSAEERERNAAHVERRVRAVAARADRLWIGRFDDVAKYAQERDSATLTATACAADRLAFTVTDRMRDDWYDYPLTVKVHLPDAWSNAVQARQNGRATPVCVVDHAGARYALVSVVPDRGEVVLTPTGGPVLAQERAASRELVVAQAGAGGAFPTIQAAVAAARPGDKVLVEGGTYHERVVVDRSGEPGAPIVVKAAPGERVVLSGFQAIEEWRDEGNGIWSAPVPGWVEQLFVDYRELQCARWPADGTRLPILSVDGDARTFQVEPVTDPRVQAVAQDPKDVVCFYHFAFGNTFASPFIKSLDVATGTLSFDEKNWNKWIRPEGNRWSLMNHPALIDAPGTWAFVRDDRASQRNGAGRVYFKPERAEDLTRVFYRDSSRPMVTVGHWKERVAHVVVDGFEVTGSADVGIKVGADDVVVRNCLVHHNAKGGIAVRSVSQIKILSNLVVANGGNGVSLAAVTDGVVEGNEIAHQQMDGLTIAGNITGRKAGTPGADKPTRDILVRRNYLHHHMMLAHPDNLQMYRDVARVKIVENFNIWGGQSLMAEEADDIVVDGNVVVGCNAVMLICGHGNSSRWTFTNNTLWGAGYGFFSLTARDYTLARNLILDGAVNYGTADQDVKSADNHFEPSFSGRSAKPWRTFTDLETVRAELGQERGSTVGPWDQPNLPRALVAGSANGGARDSIRLRRHDEKTDRFRPGDRIELNGDGVLRTVTGCAEGILAFAPALPAVPFRSVLAVNWGASTSMTVDVRAVGGRGASLSTRAFAAGDLLGVGRRTIPAMPDDVADSLPDPNNRVVPLRSL